MIQRWPLGLRAVSRDLSRAYSYSSSSPPSASAGSFPLKHVTKSNFNSALADLERHVRAADFVAIDLEMTGVTSAPWRECFHLDRFDIQYLKVKDSAEKFAVVQFGVCPFRWDPLRLSFIAQPYNFFVFPRQEIVAGGGNVGGGYEFLCQTASLDFLAKYQFDFNACIQEGVSYLSRMQEEEWRRCLNERYEGALSEKEMKDDVRVASATDVLFTARMKSRLTEWRDWLLRERNGVLLLAGTASKQQFQTVFYNLRPAVCLIGFTPHQLRLIRLLTRKHFKDLVYVSVSGESSCSEHLVVYTDSEGDRDLLMKEVKDEYHRGADTKIKEAIGFRHVVDLLSNEKKLIVGHNCFLDIAHIYSKFFGPLPLTAEEFASCLNKHFPHIIDTKLLLNADNVLKQRMKRSSTSLSKAFSLLCPQVAVGSSTSSELVFSSNVKVEVQVDDARSSNWTSGVKHEAGYDAFMTGSIFAQACRHIGIDFELHLPSENLTRHEKLQNHVNRLYLSWINGDTIDLRTGNTSAESWGSINLKGQLSKILFEDIALIWRFPSKLKSSEIRECISKVFGPTSVKSVFRVDETAVFVQFSKPELASDFLVLKESLEKRHDAISVLHPLSKLLEGGNTRAAGYETYKDICSSPISKLLFADQAEAIGIRWKTKLVDLKEDEQEVTETSQKESGADTDSVSSKESRSGEKRHAIPHPSNPQSSPEVIDSFYDEQTKQTRAINL